MITNLDKPVTEMTTDELYAWRSGIENGIRFAQATRMGEKLAATLAAHHSDLDAVMAEINRRAAA